MPKCDLCGNDAVQIGKEVFYCRDCDKIVATSNKDKNNFREIAG